ncbi:hypothetical protein GALL_06040 [mine drainage metagenome]|uniref:Transmembrane protein n=1 Tax=mine drainage metagenome TaxID=410659 RepID=A0A1J5TFJ9_9ZZZZ
MQSLQHRLLECRATHGDNHLQRIKRLFLMPLSWLAAFVFLIEEAIWDWTAALMAKLGAIRFIHAVETRIAALPPRRALFAFLLPSVTLIPAKLIGLHAIAAGHWLIGSGVFLLAKLLGMALFSRIFNLTRPALMQLAWFARLYAAVMHYRNRIHAYLDNWPAYQRVKLHLVALKTSLKAAFRRKT